MNEMCIVTFDIPYFPSSVSPWKWNEVSGNKKKSTWLFLFQKFWQFLKRFSRVLWNWEQTSYLFVNSLEQNFPVEDHFGFYL